MSRDAADTGASSTTVPARQVPSMRQPIQVDVPVQRHFGSVHENGDNVNIAAVDFSPGHRSPSGLSAGDVDVESAVPSPYRVLSPSCRVPSRRTIPKPTIRPGV